MEHIGHYLRDVHFNKKNGCLVYKQKGLQKYLFFQKGILVMVKTTHPQELLGEILLKLGKISIETFTKIDEYIDPMQSIGKTLIEEGLLTKQDLNDGLMFQMREVTLNTFPFFFGKYGFQARKNLGKKKFEYKMNVPDLIEEGIRRMDFDPRLETYLKDKIPFFSKKECMDRLTKEEKELLEAIDGNTLADELFQLSGSPPEFFWKSLYLFYCLNLIDVKEAEAKEKVPEKEKKPKKEIPPKKKKDIKVKAPKKEKVKKPALVEKKEVKKVAEKEKKAPKVIADELKRKIADLEKLRKNINTMNYYQILDVPKNASQKEIKKAYFEMARKYHPDRFDRDLPKEKKEMVEEVFGHITIAFQTFSNDKEKQDYDAKLEAPAGLDRKELEKNAESKFRQGKSLFSGGKYEEALVYFEEAIKLKSSKANYRLFLAKTEAKVPLFRGKAEEDFLKAIELEPWNPEHYVALGEFYSLEGLTIKSRRQFKKALDIEPEHEVALKALGLADPSDKKKGLKGALSFSKKKKKKS
jgi:curved DNA-binding protein CbpA